VPDPLNLSADMPPLRFRDLYVGRIFGPTRFATSRELVERFIAITGDANPLYTDPTASRRAGFPGPVLPPGLAGIWARTAYLSEHRMLPGGVMAGEDIELLAPAVVGATLILRAEVEHLEPEHPRRRVVLRSEAYSADQLVGRVRIDARWPPDEEDIDR
jgi:acyl dehydratase